MAATVDAASHSLVGSHVLVARWLLKLIAYIAFGFACNKVTLDVSLGLTMALGSVASLLALRSLGLGAGLIVASVIGWTAPGLLHPEAALPLHLSEVMVIWGLARTFDSRNFLWPAVGFWALLGGPVYLSG